MKIIANMKMIKLNAYINCNNLSDEYELDPAEEYLISLKDEMEFQTAIMLSIQILGQPPAMKNYHSWLYKNGFSVESPNPTNEFVSQFYGKKPLWKTEYSQGIVVKADLDDDFYIVMECSKKNKGYRGTKIILTLGGCI